MAYRPFPRRQINDPVLFQEGNRSKAREHLLHLYQGWTNEGSHSYAKRFETTPPEAQNYVDGKLVVMWEMGTEGYMNTWPYTFHYRFVDKLKEKVLANKPNSLETKQANELIQNILDHARVAQLNWVYYMESHGWDQPHYQEWIDKSAGYHDEAFAAQRAEVAREGKQLRAQYEAAAQDIFQKLRDAFARAAQEARPFYEKWLVAEGTVQGEQHSIVQLKDAKLEPDYSRLQNYREQTPENRKIIDEWVNKHFPGSDGEGITNSTTGYFNSEDYVRWITETVTKLFTHEMKEKGAPEVSENIYFHGTYDQDKTRKYAKARSYWPLNNKQGKLDPFADQRMNVVAGFNPKFDKGRGPNIHLFSIVSDLITIFSTKDLFFCPKFDFSAAITTFRMPDFPNRGNWRRPAGYSPPEAKPAEAAKPAAPVAAAKPFMPADAPFGADLFLEWPKTFETLFHLDAAYKNRLEVLDQWRDETKKRIEEEDAKKRSSTQWAPFNENPKDLLEAGTIYGARIAEWSKVTGGMDIVKMQEIQAWYQAQVARIQSGN